MPSGYVPPKHGQTGFNCPNPECEAFSRQQWHMHIGGFRKPQPDPGQLMRWFQPRLSLLHLARYRLNKLLIAVALVLGIAIGLVTGYGVWHESDTFETALVIRVIDGDTIELQDGSRVRYLVNICRGSRPPS